MRKCSTIMPINTLFTKDSDGCIKEDGHSGDHIFIDQNGKECFWEYDYECACGCFDDLEKDNTVGCLISNFL